MTIGFTQQINGKPNYFPEKIIAGMEIEYESQMMTLMDIMADVIEPTDEAFELGSCNPFFNHIPKLHTIRRFWKSKQTGNISERQIKAGDNLHMVINNRTPNRYQFAPTVKCVSTQRIEIMHTISSSGTPLIYIGIESIKTPGYMLCLDTYNPDLKSSSFGLIDKLAINDGFDSVKLFFDYFNTDFTGRIIHWTNLKY